MRKNYSTPEFNIKKYSVASTVYCDGSSELTGSRNDLSKDDEFDLNVFGG